MWSSIPAVAGCMQASSASVTANWVCRREMCVCGLCPGCHELHAGKLHIRPQRVGQAEAEEFLAADQASGPRGGGDSGPPHHRRVTRTVELIRTWLAMAHDAHVYADGGGAHADAGAIRARAYVNEGRGCGGADANGKDKMSLSFLFFFYFFRETVYADEGADRGPVRSPTSRIRTDRRGTDARGGALALHQIIK
jgi:hypothetical protein